MYQYSELYIDLSCQFNYVNGCESRLREIIDKYSYVGSKSESDSDIAEPHLKIADSVDMPADSGSLEAHLRIALAVLWAAGNGRWHTFNELINENVSQLVMMWPLLLILLHVAV